MTVLQMPVVLSGSWERALQIDQPAKGVSSKTSRCRPVIVNNYIPSRRTSWVMQCAYV